ncbi:GNAT family N-acetyltransferase [Nonomuraea sp. NPDC050786]|uniref:GNAT family N-acetyltransferase n=1 Tax=Nonomuraea sp. NPDC050786 TaxID=3154840 RepID=UPI0033DF37DF
MSVLVSAESWLCPPGWTGIVALDGAILATVPDPDLIEPLQAALLHCVGGIDADVDLTRLPTDLPAVDVLGPAALAYLDAENFAAAHADIEVESLPTDHHEVRGLVASVAKQDADESGLEEIDSTAFVVRMGQDVVAAAGYRPWLNTAAHLSVLTAPEYRDRGLARLVASAAVADALRNRLVPQWRARPEPSRRVARALGFREFGSQISVQLGR